MLSSCSSHELGIYWNLIFKYHINLEFIIKTLLWIFLNKLKVKPTLQDSQFHYILWNWFWGNQVWALMKCDRVKGHSCPLVSAEPSLAYFIRKQNSAQQHMLMIILDNLVAYTEAMVALVWKKSEHLWVHTLSTFPKMHIFDLCCHHFVFASKWYLNFLFL